ncbi:MAG: hypothetical protein V3R77_10195 [Candidatus Binatia bacterium]
MTEARSDTAIAAGIWLAAVAFYLTFDPFNRFVGLDAATWDWMSISLLDGRIPYRDVFLHKTPGAALLGGAGAALARTLGATPLAGAHASCIAFGAAGPALLYLICRERMGVIAALAAAAFMLSFDQWVVASVEGVRPKIFTTTLGLVALLASERRRWLAAGIAGGAATLCWQPGLAFLLGSLWALRAEESGGRIHAVTRMAVGAAIAPALLLAWLAAAGALRDFFAQSILFNFQYIHLHARSPEGTLRRLLKLTRQWNPAELFLLAPALLGALLQRSRVPAGLMVAGAAYLALAFVSFQAWPDMILFSAPTAALLAAGLSSLVPASAPWQAVVLALAAALAARPASARLEPPITFEDQSRFMHSLTTELTDDDTVLVVSLPEFMIHTGRQSVWKWPYLWFGVDRFAAESTPGGFDALLAELSRHPPGLMLVARRWQGPLRAQFDRWAAPLYRRTRVHHHPHTVKPINVYRLDRAPRTHPSDDG